MAKTKEKIANDLILRTMGEVILKNGRKKRLCKPGLVLL